jgi:hypothetical protein
MIDINNQQDYFTYYLSQMEKEKSRTVKLLDILFWFLLILQMIAIGVTLVQGNVLYALGFFVGWTLALMAELLEKTNWI